jgi:hypothetical protein
MLNKWKLYIKPGVIAPATSLQLSKSTSPTSFEPVFLDESGIEEIPQSMTTAPKVIQILNF